jgi:hypothetical protein
MTSFFNILKHIPIGVTRKKKTKPITIGDINLPIKIPNRIHILFKKVNKLGARIVIIKNTKDKIRDQILTIAPDFNG